MSATRTQQIGIWIIAAIMAIGTVGSFAIIVLANDNAQRDQARVKELESGYQKEYEAYQAAMGQAEALSAQYYPILSQYASLPAPFDAARVTELGAEDLVVGTGADISLSSTFAAYYIGWGPDGQVFDSSIDGSSLKPPITAYSGGVIPGWTQGAAGMKVGGVRELTIPSALAYGEAGSGNIAPNTPLKFVIMVVAIAPDYPPELLKYYQTGRL